MITTDIMRPGGLALTARAIRYCSFKAGAVVADIGCGAGESVEFLRQESCLDAIGIDCAEVPLKRGIRRNPELPLVRCVAEKLPFASASLDGILAECTLSVLPDRDRVLAEFNRALRQGGKLVVTDVYSRDTCAINLIHNMQLPFCMSGIMTEESLTGKLARRGFTIELWEDHCHVLKEFVFRMIMEHGSFEGLSDLKTLKQACLSYFLLIARKDT